MNKPSFISVFSGAGGLDLGLRVAGYRHLLSIEIDPVCRKTLRLNYPRIKLSNKGDICKVSSNTILHQAGIKKRELNLLVGGPPCQPFSKSGYWANSSTKRMKDPRAKTLKEYMRVVHDLLPQNVIIENVSGMMFSDKNDGLKYLNRKFKKINAATGSKYVPVIIKLNAADYGVPQLRERIFIIANRKGKTFEAPKITHSPESTRSNNNLQRYLTAWDAIGDLDIDIWPDTLNIKGKWADLAGSIPEGQNYLWHTDRSGGVPLFGWRTRYWSFLLKLANNKPSWTITAQPGPAIGPLHWKSRYLSVKEMARLQTFPDKYSFVGSYREQQLQIGNAVPPAIGELLGLEIRRQIYGRRVRSRLKLIPKPKKTTPKAERVRKLDRKYQSLIGQYDEHPGVGKGPGAKNNQEYKLARK